MVLPFVACPCLVLTQCCSLRLQDKSVLDPEIRLEKIPRRVAEYVLVTLHFVFKLSTILLHLFEGICCSCDVFCSSYCENLYEPGFSVSIISYNETN